MESLKKFTAVNVSGFGWGFILGLNFLWSSGKDKERVRKEKVPIKVEPKKVETTIQENSSIPQKVELPIVIPVRNNNLEIIPNERLPNIEQPQIVQPTSAVTVRSYRDLELIQNDIPVERQIEILQNNGELPIVENFAAAPPAIQGLYVSYAFYGISVIIPFSMYIYFRIMRAFNMQELIELSETLRGAADFNRERIIRSGIPINENEEFDELGKLTNMQEKLDSLMGKLKNARKPVESKKPSLDELKPGGTIILNENQLSYINEEEGKQEQETEGEKSPDEIKEIIKNEIGPEIENEQIKIEIKEEEADKEIPKIAVNENIAIEQNIIEIGGGQQQIIETQRIQNIAIELFQIELPPEYMQLDENIRAAIESLARGEGIIASIRILKASVGKIAKGELRKKIKQILKIARSSGQTTGSENIIFIPFYYNINVYNVSNVTSMQINLFEGQLNFGDNIFREIINMNNFHYYDRAHSLFEIIKDLYQQGGMPNELMVLIQTFIVNPTVANFRILCIKSYELSLNTETSMSWKTLYSILRLINSIVIFYNQFYKDGEFIKNMKLVAPTLINTFFFTKIAIESIRTAVKTTLNRFPGLRITYAQYMELVIKGKETEIECIDELIRSIELLKSQGDNPRLLITTLHRFIYFLKKKYSPNESERESNFRLYAEKIKFDEFLNNLLEKYPYDDKTPSQPSSVLSEEQSAKLIRVLFLIARIIGSGFHTSTFK